MDMLDRNLAALSSKDSSLAATFSRVVSSGRYLSVATAKNGSAVPVFDTGFPAHSLYDPEKEANRAIDALGGGIFPVFLGLGGGYRVREFLRRNPNDSCAVVEADRADLVSLFIQVDLCDILSDARVTLIPSITKIEIRSALLGSYLPALHGGLTVVPSSVHWMHPDDKRIVEFNAAISETLKTVTADFSVQAHFGKLWLRNFCINIRRASRWGSLFSVDATKRAVVAAAGPSLEAWIKENSAMRRDFCVIATDTAYSTLIRSGIVPDYFVSIDSQHVSAYHGSISFSRATTLAIELCGNPGLADIAERSGAPFLYFSGTHPLSQLAASRFGFQTIATGSGTVTMAAYGLAQALGFTSVDVAGGDFAYTNGKPYARGTYLEDRFGSSSSRLIPAEHRYASLIFRTPVRREFNAPGKITYRTDILDSYKAAFTERDFMRADNSAAFKPFDWDLFLGELRELLSEEVRTGKRDAVFYAMLPFVAWYRNKHPASHSNTVVVDEALQLALRLIEGYNQKS